MKWISSKQAAELGKSLAAIVLAFVIGALFILVAGESPATAYSSLLKGALGTPQAVANTVSKSIPLAFTGLAVALGSRCGMLNIGAEGQLHAGAMAATLTGLTLSFLPAPILLVVSIAAGIAAGMLVGSVPGIFKAKFQTNEVIVAIMLNYVCTLFTSWLVNGPFKVPGSTAQTEMLPENTTSRGLTREENSLCYKWRLGNIYYTKCGSGKPLLLIHDLHFASSGYEWESIREQLSRSYTVYTLDLLGCGRSEKPNLTYTNYLFVQLICDFIKSEIGHRTNILSTGDSAALSIMACSNSPELFDQIMLINPSSLTDCCQLPGKNAKLYKLLLDLPLAGTLIYHIACSRSMIEEAFRTKYFYNPYTVKPVQIDRSHEAAHLGECPKAIFSSIECRYTKCNISNALRKIDNSIFIIGGSEEPMIEATIQDYKIYNSAIESSIIPKTKHLPQLEQPDAVMDAIHMFFS